MWMVVKGERICIERKPQSHKEHEEFLSPLYTHYGSLRIKMRVRGDTHNGPERGNLARRTLKSTGWLFLEIFDEVEEGLHA